MAHSCPECDVVCHCAGGENQAILCTHCLDDHYDDYEDDWEEEDDEQHYY